MDLLLREVVIPAKAGIQFLSFEFEAGFPTKTFGNDGI